MHQASPVSTIVNRILVALPRGDKERLIAQLESVPLEKNKVISEVGHPINHAYFINRGMVSLLSMTEEGETVEVATVGREGVVGLASLLRVNRPMYRTVVQFPGEGLRIRAEALRSEVKRGGALQDLLLCYLHALVTQTAQAAACHRVHRLEERLARWLLVTRDRAGSSTLHLTQEFISRMLGIPRTSVSEMAGALQRGGLIHYSRGVITILDAEGLEGAACGCYRVIKGTIDNCLIG